MDTDPLHKAIHDETLSNEEALIELFERRDHCLASDYSQSMHTNIVRIFEEAVLDAKKAVAAHEPVVKVLKKAMTDVGRLFVAERRAAAAASTSKPEKPSQRVTDVNTTETQAKASASTLPQQDVHLGKSKGEQKSDPTDRATGGKAPIVVDAPHVDDNTDLGHNIAAKDPPQDTVSNSQHRAVPLKQAKGKQKAEAVREGSHDTGPLPPARSVSPDTPMGKSTPTSIAASSTAAAFASAFAPSKRPPPGGTMAPAGKRRNTLLNEKQPAGKKRRQRSKPKSDELVVDSEDSDNNVEDTSTVTLSQRGVVDLSEGISGFENLDKNGRYAKKPHGRWLLVDGKRQSALVVKLKISPEKLREVLQQKDPQAATSAYQSAQRDTTGSKKSSLPVQDQKPGSSLRPTRTNIVSDDEDPAWESDTAAAAPPIEVTFASFPNNTAATLPAFLKGLIIAVENILTDHAEYPDATILELVQELEENKPTLPAGNEERHIVVRGSEYVYAAVHQICDEAVRDGDDTVNTPAVDADGDTKMESAPDVKLTDDSDGITALTEKPRYKGKGRAWKKTPGDADPAYQAKSKLKLNIANLPKRALSRRKATRAGAEAASKEPSIQQLFESFCAHVKGEYWFQAGRLGVMPVKSELPKWLLED